MATAIAARIVRLRGMRVLSRRGGGERERQGLAVHPGAERLGGSDVLVERDRDDAVAERTGVGPERQRQRCERSGGARLQWLGQREGAVEEAARGGAAGV